MNYNEFLNICSHLIKLKKSECIIYTDRENFKKNFSFIDFKDKLGIDIPSSDDKLMCSIFHSGIMFYIINVDFNE